MPITASAAALTTIAKVKQYGVANSSDASGDQVIQTLINMASEAIHDFCQREFVSTVGTGTRVFGYSGGNYLPFGKWDLQSLTTLQLDTDTANPSTLATTAYQLAPVDKPHGVYRGVRFYSFSIGDPMRQAAGFQRQMSVTGTWGFASVPAAVEQACIITCVVWLRRDLQYLTRTYNPETGIAIRPDSLPSAATSLLAPFRRF